MRTVSSHKVATEPEATSGLPERVQEALGELAGAANATLQVKDVNDAILQRLLDDETVRAQMTHLVMRSLYDRYTGAAEPGR